MPQAKRSLALIYAVNPFGADHQSSEHDPYYEEGVGDFNLDRLKQIGLGSPQPAYSLTEEKVRFAYETEVFYSMLDSLELCQFVYGPTWTLYDGEQTAEMVRAVTTPRHLYLSDTEAASRKGRGLLRGDTVFQNRSHLPTRKLTLRPNEAGKAGTRTARSA